MSLLSVWGLAAFGLVVGWACVLVVGAAAWNVRAVVFILVFLSAAVGVAYLIAGSSGSVEVGSAALTGLLFHTMTRAALRHRAYRRSLTG